MSNAYQLITDRILSKLDSGVAPWRKPWTAESGSLGSHLNIASLKEYRGVNAVITYCMGFDSKYWGTYTQWASLGAQVRKGEKSTPVVYWSKAEKELPSGEKEDFAFCKYSSVFNLEQCDNTDKIKKIVNNPVAIVRTDFERIEAIEKLLDAVFKRESTLTMRNGGNRAFYMPLRDAIQMPELKAFPKATDYYATLFHELGHATGHESRLARKGIIAGSHSFGSHEYSKEELVAELTSAFLCGHTGIDTATLDNSASYLASWLKVLKTNPPKFIADASSAAQKASDMILGKAEL